jgi:hypothetical protein
MEWPAIVMIVLSYLFRDKNCGDSQQISSTGQPVKKTKKIKETT